MRWIFTGCALLASAACTDLGPATPSGIAVVPLDNPTDWGSTESHLSVTVDGKPVLSWLEPFADGHALRFSVLEADGWTPVGTVARGDGWFINWADFPSVVPLSEELWAAHWLVLRPEGGYAYDVAVALSRDGGETWSEPVRPHTDDTATEHGFVTLFPWSEGAGVVWLDGRETVREGAVALAAMAAPSGPAAAAAPGGASPGGTAPGGTAPGGEAAGGEAAGGAAPGGAVPTGEAAGHHETGAGPTMVRVAMLDTEGRLAREAVLDPRTCDCCQTDVAVTPDGPVVAYRDRSEGEVRDIAVTSWRAGAWTPPANVTEDGWRIKGCPVNGPAIAADARDVVVAWYTEAGGRPRVRFARSGDGARSFGEPVDIDAETPLGRADVVLLDNGDAVVSWLARRDGGAAVVVRRVRRDGDLGPMHEVGSADAGRASGFPQLVSVGDDLYLSWTEADHGLDHVRVTHLRYSAD